LILHEENYEQSGDCLTSSNQLVFKTEQCVKTLTTCCAQQKVNNLIDNQSNTYWETNSSECDSHSILIQLKDNITALRLYLSFYLSKDDSFRSQYVEISVSEDLNKIFHLISTCKIQTSSTSSTMLELESTSSDTNKVTNSSTNSLFTTLPNEFLLCDLFPQNQNYSYIKISIKSNQTSSSSTIRVKSIRLLGVKRDVNKQQTVKDASICWFFDILSSIALLQSQIVPSMYNNLINISKSALSNMPPLSLSSNNDSILSDAVLSKADVFLKNLINNYPSQQATVNKQQYSNAVMIYLEFNLARGHLKNILFSLNWIIENHQLNFDFRHLIQKIDSVSEDCVRKTADQLKFEIIYADGMPNEMTNMPNFLLENNTNQQSLYFNYN
jgi:hypothetical protein